MVNHQVCSILFSEVLFVPVTWKFHKQMKQLLYALTVCRSLSCISVNPAFYKIIVWQSAVNWRCSMSVSHGLIRSKETDKEDLGCFTSAGWWSPVGAENETCHSCSTQSRSWFVCTAHFIHRWRQKILTQTFIKNINYVLRSFKTKPKERSTRTRLSALTAEILSLRFFLRKTLELKQSYNKKIHERKKSIYS